MKAAAPAADFPPSLRRMLSSRPPTLAYAAILFVGAISVPFLLSLDGSLYSDRFLRRSLSNGSLYSINSAGDYANFQNADDIDRSIEARARRNDDPDRCSRVLLYLPDFFADHGHGSQINTYIMGVTTSTYLDRAMVLLEPPVESSRYAGGSQFGCPVDAFRETMTKTSLRREAEWHVKPDFPLGYSRLVDQPSWLSHGCGVPSCGEEYDYQKWVQVYQSYKGGDFPELTCTDPETGAEVNVAVTGGGKLRQYFRDHETSMVRTEVNSPVMKRWAFNLGATATEANLFASIRDSRQIWDFVLALMNKAGFLRLRPWIARDVELFLKTFDLPMEGEYSAIHVRRGDKLEEEARGEVVRYWRSQGYTDDANLPTDYVPFAHYLSQWDGPEACETGPDGQPKMMRHNVYVATDDPVVVRQEIAALPNHVDEYTIVHNQCHQLTFYFNPTDDSAFHLNGDGEKGFEDKEVEDSCFMRYHRNVASVADMMILSKAKTFIGEYNSNWGRVIRTMRVRLSLPAVESDGGKAVLVQGVDGLTRTLDTRIAWGSTRERTPGY